MTPVNPKAPEWDHATLEKANQQYKEYARRRTTESHPKVETEAGESIDLWAAILTTLSLPQTFHNVMSFGDALEKGFDFEGWLADLDYKLDWESLTTENLHAYFATYCEKRRLHPKNYVGLRVELSELLGFGPSIVGIMMCEHFLQKGFGFHEMIRRATQFFNCKDESFRAELKKVANQDVHFFFYKIVFLDLSEKYIELVKSYFGIRGCLFRTEVSVTDENYSDIRGAAVVISSKKAMDSISGRFKTEELEMQDLGLEELSMLDPIPALLIGEDPEHIPQMEKLMTKRFKAEVTE